MADEKAPMYKATVGTVINTNKEGQPLTKTREDGRTARYDLCTVEINEGPLAGKTVWAQRTLVNREGREKEPVVEKQEVSVVITIVENKPFFEIATGMPIASDEELMALLGVDAKEPVKIGS
jgi:hypothetical protein